MYMNTHTGDTCCSNLSYSNVHLIKIFSDFTPALSPYRSTLYRIRDGEPDCIMCISWIVYSAGMKLRCGHQVFPIFFCAPQKFAVIKNNLHIIKFVNLNILILIEDAERLLVTFPSYTHSYLCCFYKHTLYNINFLHYMVSDKQGFT
jgi:hypothetical protein